MALTIPRWLTLAVTGCLIVWIGLFARLQDPREQNAAQNSQTSTGTPADLKRLLEGKVQQANERWRLIDLRDSVTRAAPTAASKPLSLLIDARFGERTKHALDSALSSRWEALGLTNSAPTIVAAIIDTTHSAHDLPRQSRNSSMPITAFLPSAETGGRCVSLLVFNSDLSNLSAANANRVLSYLRSKETISALLAPCAFVAKFGPPGRGMKRWLMAQNWTDARFANWDSAPSPWASTLTKDFLRFARMYSPFTGAADSSWQIRMYVAPPGIACIAGHHGACEPLLLSSAPTIRDSAWRENVVAASGTTASTFYFETRASALGPASGMIVSEMVRTLGPERFARVWRSPQPFDQAFQQASPGGLDAWMHDWMLRTYGRAGVGPSMSTQGLCTGLAALLLGLGVAILIARRRSVV